MYEGGAERSSGDVTQESAKLYPADGIIQSDRSPLGNLKEDELEEQTDEERDRRLRLYKRDDVRRFASWILRGHERIEPLRNPISGEYDYSTIGFDSDKVGRLVKELEYHKILQPYLVDTVPTCPKCGHSNFHVVYLCPYCQHSTLEHGTMIEHYKCGHTDFEDNFRSENELICPKCRGILRVIGTDYRKIEHWFRCVRCNKNFGLPKNQFLCRQCDRVNTENELLMQRVYGYELNKSLRGELLSHCSLEVKFNEMLRRSGFKVIAPTKKVGLSGTTYSFDLGANKDQHEIVFDLISVAGQVEPQDVMAFLAKVYDVKPPRVFLVATPRVSKNAEKLCTLYGVELVVAEEQNVILDLLVDRLGLSMDAELSSIWDATQIAGNASSSLGPLKTPVTQTLLDMPIDRVEVRQEHSSESNSTEDLESPDDMLQAARIKMVRLIEEANRRI
jgi:uncharacterized protein YbaR (Trm112 family)